MTVVSRRSSDWVPRRWPGHRRNEMSFVAAAMGLVCSLTASAAPDAAMRLDDLDDLLGSSHLPRDRVWPDGVSATSEAGYRWLLRARLKEAAFYEVFAPKLLGILDVHTAPTFF